MPKVSAEALARNVDLLHQSRAAEGRGAGELFYAVRDQMIEVLEAF